MSEIKRFGVTGGRSYNNRDAVRDALEWMPDTATMVQGAAPGADRLCASLWRIMGRPVEPHPAQWGAACRPSCEPRHRRQGQQGDYCPAAGAYRNQDMVDSGLDALIVFPGGTGTADMVQRAERADIPLFWVDR